MDFLTHQIDNRTIVEITSTNASVLSNIEEGINLVGNLYFQGIEQVILYEKNIHPDFFDLKTGMAGEILQKFSTYSIRLAIVGDFSKYESKSLQDFIRESNKQGFINFVSSLSEAKNSLTRES